MKRLIAYILLITIALLVPVQRTDVAKLRPVQVVHLRAEGGRIVLETDTGDVGTGIDAMTALSNLQATTPAVIYLDTAKYLLVAQEALGEVDSLRVKLKDSVCICQADGEVMQEDTAAFLIVHGQLPQLKDWKNGDPLPVLTGIKKRLIFTKKSEESA